MSQVFISYRHSDTHSPRVADLAKALRAAGVNVVIDSDQLPAGPNEGWPKWSQQQVEKADKVLIACTQGWRECYEADGPLEIGHGCAAEAHIVRQMLYKQGFNNARFRVVLLAPEDSNSIPLGLQAYHRFHWHKPEEQAHLLTWLSMGLSHPAIPWPTLHAPFDRRIANRDTEFQLFEAMLQGHSTQRALLIQGESGLGKSTLLKAFVRLARQLRLEYTLIDCAHTPSLAVAIEMLDTGIATLSPTFQGIPLPDRLEYFDHPHLLLIDTFERATPDFYNWVSDKILENLESYPRILIVVCRKTMPYNPSATWKKNIKNLVLQPITEPEAWMAFCNHSAPIDFVQQLVDCTRGNPALIGLILQSALSKWSSQ